jgi:hypothetical protein
MSASATSNNQDDDGDGNANGNGEKNTEDKVPASRSEFSVTRCVGKRLRLYQTTEPNIFGIGKFMLEIGNDGRLYQIDDLSDDVLIDSGTLVDCVCTYKVQHKRVYAFLDADTKRVVAHIKIDVQGPVYSIAFFDETPADVEERLFLEALLQ